MKKYIKCNKSNYINVDLWGNNPRYLVWFCHKTDDITPNKIALALFYSLANAKDYAKYIESQSNEIEVEVDIL